MRTVLRVSTEANILKLSIAWCSLVWLGSASWLRNPGFIKIHVFFAECILSFVRMRVLLTNIQWSIVLCIIYVHRRSKILGQVSIYLETGKVTLDDKESIECWRINDCIIKCTCNYKIMLSVVNAEYQSRKCPKTFWTCSLE